MKKCYKCQQTKDFSCFNKNKAKHDGLASQCRECGVKISKQSYKDNKKKRNEESLAYYQKNKETIAIKNKEYVKNNVTTEKRRVYRNNWLSKYPDRQNILHKKWRDENRDHLRKWQANYRNKNKDAHYSYALKRRSYKHKVIFNRFERTELLQRDNYTCQQCNVKVHDRRTGDWNDEFKAHIDHIVPISRGGDSTPENLRVLCRTCNLSKSDKTDIIIKKDGQIQLTI